MKPLLFTFLLTPITFIAQPSLAHHSFAIYELDNKIERSGLLTKFEFINPHIQLELKVNTKNNGIETWQIESINVHRWDRSKKARDVAHIGETVTLIGWPARNGNNEMFLSAIITERGETIILREVRQERAQQTAY